MAEGDIVQDVRAEVADDSSIGDESGQQFVLLLRVTQPNSRPFPG